MLRDSCRNDENPEKNFFEKKKIEIFFFIILTTNPWHGGVYKAHGKFRLQGFKIAMGEVNF